MVVDKGQRKSRAEKLKCLFLAIFFCVALQLQGWPNSTRMWELKIFWLLLSGNDIEQTTNSYKPNAYNKA